MTRRPHRSVRPRARSAAAAVLGAVAVLAVAVPPSAAAQDAADEAVLTVDRQREVPGHEDRLTHQTLLTTRESDCYELSLTRAARLEALRAAVPERYELLRTGATTGRVQITTTSCEVSVDGQQRTRRSIVSHGLVAVTARDGVPTGGYYLLWLATDDPVLAARYRQLGFPARFLPHSSFALGTDAKTGRPSVEFDIVGEGLHHRLRALVTPAPSTAKVVFTVYYDSPDGDLRLREDSQFTAVGSASYSTDLTAIDGFVALLVEPRFAVLNGTTFTSGFVRADATRRVERVD